jgi:hypothetical protein
MEYRLHRLPCHYAINFFFLAVNLLTLANDVLMRKENGKTNKSFLNGAEQHLMFVTMGSDT